ncbi:MAG: hybrid sensor histidine kinase/response regulator [Cyanobacteria bacterium J06641_5]
MQSKQHQSERGQFAGQAKEHLQILKQGLQDLKAIVADDRQRFESLAQVASTLAQEAAAIELDNLSEIAGKLAGTFLAFHQSNGDLTSDAASGGNTNLDCDAIQKCVEPLWWRSYQTLQGMVEMQEMGEAAFMVEDVEREVMAGMQPILTQLETQTCELTGLAKLPALPISPSPEPSPAGAPKDSLSLEGDLWTDEAAGEGTLDLTSSESLAALDLLDEEDNGRIVAGESDAGDLPSLDFDDSASLDLESDAGDLPSLDFDGDATLDFEGDDAGDLPVLEEEATESSASLDLEGDAGDLPSLDFDSSASLDLEGDAAGLPDLGLDDSDGLADLEELFSSNPNDESTAPIAEAELDEELANESLTDLSSLEAWEEDPEAATVQNTTADDLELPQQPAVPEEDPFQPGSFEPLEDLEALFAGEGDGEEESFDATQDDVFSELETLTDIPTWAVTPVDESAKDTWSSELPSAVPQRFTIEYFTELEAIEPLLEVVADAGALPSAETNNLSFDLAELEAFLERPATASLAVTPSPATATPKAPSRPTVPAVARRAPRAFEQSLKVPVRQMDNLSNLIGELVVNRNGLEQDQERLRRFLDNLLDQVQNLNDLGGRMQDLYERSLLESSLLASRTSAMGSGNGNGGRGGAGPIDEREIDPLEIDRFTGFHLISQEMMEMIVRVRESSSDIEFLVDQVDNGARNLRQITTELQENVTSTRMVPFSQIADSLPRAVRDIASKMNKQAKLHVEGRDTLVDKMILEQLYDPLTHLLNNAMTHGIEGPETRVALSKDPSGRIVIRSQHQGNQTIISISDDGAGIDPGRIKRKAVEKGLISAAEAEALSEIETYDFIFHPGFSTRDQADNFAGRGVGMDVVRSTLSKLRGSITIDSKLGKGTTFTIGLPLTLSIGKALCCIHEQSRIAFPMDGVEDMLDILPSDISADANGERYISWQSKKTKARATVPFKSLTELLSYNRKRSRAGYVAVAPKDDDETLSVVLLRGTGGLIAAEVDSVIGEQEIVIKQIIGPIPKPVGIAGATVLGDGSVMAIADVLEIIDLFYGRVRKSAIDSALLDPHAGEEQETTEPRVLIVDDSITVRELLSMSFKKAGYRVEQARDGQEAWDKLRGGLQTDLIFCDIDMPRMDGLELLSRISQDEELSKIPMSMLTSRGADRHRQMAAKFGAKAYFTKPYLEEVLLDAANRMRAGEVLI